MTFKLGDKAKLLAHLLTQNEYLQLLHYAANPGENPTLSLAHHFFKPPPGAAEMQKNLSHLLLQVPVHFLFGYHFQLSVIG